MDSPLLTQQIEAQRLSIKHLKNENNRLKVSPTSPQAHFPKLRHLVSHLFLCLCMCVWTAGRKDACSAGVSHSSERAKAGLERGLQAGGVV